MNMKRIVSLLLALVMVLGMVIPPSQAHAMGEEEFVEADYKVENEEGESYKVYEFTDIVGTSEPNNQFEIDGLDVSEPRIMQAVRGSNPNLGEELSYSVEVQWTTYDLAPGDLGTPVFFQIRDKTTKKFIAQTENITEKAASKSYKFYKLPAWDDQGVSHNPSDWNMRVPVAYKFDVRLDTGASGNFEYSNIKAKVVQRSNPIYRAEYFTNKTIPTIEVQRTNKNNRTNVVPINKANLSTNEYYSWAEPISGYVEQYYEGKLLEIKKDKYGNDALASLEISDDITAGRCRMKMKAPGKTEFDRGPGTFKDNGTPYHYEVTGDHIKAHIFTIRQDLKVNFDPNGGTWKGTAPAEQTIGHSMKLGDSWAGLGPISVPGAGDLTPPTVAAGKPEKEFIGWNTDANATTALFTDNTYAQPITADVTTFYAIYKEKAQGKVTLEYVDASGNAIVDKYKITGQSYPTEKGGNIGETVGTDVASTAAAPKFLGYKVTGVDVKPATGQTTATYTDPATATVTYKYKKLDDIIPAKDDNGNDNPDVADVKDTYKKVTIKVDSTKGKFQKNSADVTGSEFLYYVNPVEGKSLQDVLTASGLTPVALDENKAKIDDQNKWKFDPKQTEGTATVPAADFALATVVGKDNVKDTGVTMEVNFKQTTADKFKDKLDPQDIKVWVKDQIDWKKGVKLKEANEELQKILDKTETKVTDESNRNSDTQNLPGGKKGNLKVTFDDGSALVVENQTLYVAPHKNDNNTNLPEDAVKVDFKIGEGVTGTAKTEYVKPGTDVKEDAPAVTLKEGFKDAKWYKGEAESTTEATDADYKVTANAVFTAKATGKDKVVKLDDPDNPTNFPKDPTDNNKKDADYVTVKFVADANGKIKENGTVKDKGIAYAVLKNTEWADAVKAGVVVPTEFEGTTKFYTFKEWQKDGTKVATFPKVEATDLTFTAVFGKADELSVTYNLNAPEDLTVGGTAPTDEEKYVKNDEVTVKALAADNTLAGYKFTGWNTQAEGKGTTYAAGAKFAIKANTELFAQWEKTAKDVIPVDNENDKKGKDGEEIPTNYVFVDFKVKDTDADKAEIKDGQQAKFKVDPKATVTLTAPALELKGDYKDSHIAKFNKDDYTNKKFAQATTIWAVVTEKGKVTVKYVFNTNPANKTLPKDLADLKPADITEAIYEDEVVDPAQPDVSKDPAKAALVEKDKDGKEVGTWTPGTWVRTENSGNITFTLTWTFTEAGKPQPEQPPMPDYNPWWPIWFGSTTEVKKEEPKHLENHEAYIAGYPDGTVRPDGNMTRAEAIAVVARLQKLDLSDKSSNIYKDTKAGMWYNSAINAAFREGYLLEKEGEDIRPDDKITRAELALLISHIDKKNNAVAPFEDVKGHKFEAAINQAYGNERIKGYPDGTFRPDNSITRAEVATMLNKLYDRVADAEFIREHGFEIKKFKDLLESNWAYYQLLEATNSHDYERMPGGFEKWDKIVK